MANSFPYHKLAVSNNWHTVSYKMANSYDKITFLQMANIAHKMANSFYKMASSFLQKMANSFQSHKMANRADHDQTAPLVAIRTGSKLFVVKHMSLFFSL